MRRQTLMGLFELENLDLNMAGDDRLRIVDSSALLVKDDF